MFGIVCCDSKKILKLRISRANGNCLPIPKQIVIFNFHRFVFIIILLPMINLMAILALYIYFCKYQTLYVGHHAIVNE